MVSCDICHVLTSEYVEDCIKINGAMHDIKRCKECQIEFEYHSNKPADGKLTLPKKSNGNQLLEEPEKITRLEVIGIDGREYVRYFEPGEVMRYMIQDDGRTLKIVIKK